MNKEMQIIADYNDRQNKRFFSIFCAVMVMGLSAVYSIAFN